LCDKIFDFTFYLMSLFASLIFYILLLASTVGSAAFTIANLIFVVSISLLLGALVSLVASTMIKYKTIKRITPEFRIKDAFRLSLPVEKILKYRLSVCRDYAKLTSALLLNLYPENEHYFILIPNHVATAIKINHKIYVLDQKLPILTFEKWKQKWCERFKKKNLKVGFIRIIYDGIRVETKYTYHKGIGNAREAKAIDTSKIVKDLKKKLGIKKLDSKTKGYLQITLPFKNYGDYYEEDDIIEFSISESMKNKIEDELAGNVSKIRNLVITTKDRDFFLTVYCRL